ncbi:MAG: hypothetical protein ACRDI3_04575 [Actinomycetota bacterium]
MLAQINPFIADQGFRPNIGLSTFAEIASLAIFITLLFVVGVWISSWVAQNSVFRKQIVQLFLAAYAIRLIAMMVFFYWVPEVVADHPYLSFGFFGDDAIAYDQVAIQTLSQWEGGSPIDLLSVPIPGSRGYILLNIAVYAIFGHQMLAVRALDAFMGALVPVFTFAIAASLLPRRWALAVAVAVAFYPEQIVYSVTQNKDISLTFAIALFMWLTMRFRRGATIGGTLGMSACLLYVVATRFYFAVPMVIAAVVAYVIRPTRRRLDMGRLGVAAAVLLGLVVMTAVMLNVLAGINVFDPFAAGQAEFFLPGQSQVGDQSFYAIFQGATGARAILLLPVTFAFSILNPFPLWTILTPDPVFTILSPSIFLWYLIIPFAAFGFFKKMFDRTWIPIIVFVAATMFLLALSGVGAAAVGRHKVPLQPAFFIMGAYGVQRFLAGERAARLSALAYGAAIGALGAAYLFLRERFTFYGVALALVIIVLYQWLRPRFANLTPLKERWRPAIR